jgi:hypothetical protein
VFVAVNQFANAQPTSAAAHKQREKKPGDDITDKFRKLIQRFRASLTGNGDVVNLACQLKFNVR